MGAKIKCGKCGGDIPVTNSCAPSASKFPKDILKWRESPHHGNAHNANSNSNNTNSSNSCFQNSHHYKTTTTTTTKREDLLLGGKNKDLKVIISSSSANPTNRRWYKKGGGQTKSSNISANKIPMLSTSTGAGTGAGTGGIQKQIPPESTQLALDRPLSLSLWSSLSVPSNLNRDLQQLNNKNKNDIQPKIQNQNQDEETPPTRRRADTANASSIQLKTSYKEPRSMSIFQKPQARPQNANFSVTNSCNKMGMGGGSGIKSSPKYLEPGTGTGAGRGGHGSKLSPSKTTGGSGGKSGGDKDKEKDLKKVVTLWQNYYPEGQWGWVILFCAFMVQVTTHGSQLAYSILWRSISRRFRVEDPLLLGLLGGISVASSLLLSPLWVSICKRKSTRLVGILGGLIAALAWLFTSFASQFHQLYLSYGVFLGIGVGLCRDASCLMIGGYFKRKREFVEMLIVAASGVGIISMSLGIHCGVKLFGWRIGLEAVTLLLLIPFFLGICYRSASLYHPQRRAILHLKNQRRKVKEKYKRDDGPPFFDWTCLKSITLRILLLSSCLTAFGIYIPLFYLSFRCKELKIDQSSTLLLQMYLGSAWIVGSILFGIFIIQKNQDCRVSKQYLCQGSEALCGLSMLGLPFAEEFGGLRIFACVYGLGLGAHAYTIKVYTYERARARHFPRAWSFVQCVQGISIIGGTAVTGFLFSRGKTTIGFHVAAGATILGAILLFLADVRRKNLAARGKPTESFKTVNHPKICNLTRVLTPTLGDHVMTEGEGSGGSRAKNDSGCDLGQESFDSSLINKNLASISEEGFVEIDVDYDADFQDIYFEDWEEMVGLGADAITSCNKVENCLMSEAGDGDSDQIVYYIEKQPSTRFHKPRRRIPGFRKPYKTIQGISFPPLRVASGVIGMSTMDPRLNLNRSKLCEIVESESLSSSPPPSSSHCNSSAADQQQQQQELKQPHHNHQTPYEIQSQQNTTDMLCSSPSSSRGFIQDLQNSVTYSQTDVQITKDVLASMRGSSSSGNFNTDLKKSKINLPLEIPSYDTLQRQKGERRNEN